MGFDMIGAIDQSGVFKPSVSAVYGWICIGEVLVAGPFVYRPWRHFFRPFGLVGWVLEKISGFEIEVNVNNIDRRGLRQVRTVTTKEKSAGCSGRLFENVMDIESR
jgi:hypothetical protein